MKSLTPSVIFSGAAGRRLEDQSGHIHDHPRDARSTQNRAGYLLSTYRAHRVSKVGEANADCHGSPRPEFGSEPAHADAKKMEKLAVRIRFAGSGWSAIREYWDSVLKDSFAPAATASGCNCSFRSSAGRCRQQMCQRYSSFNVVVHEADSAACTSDGVDFVTPV